MAEHKHRKSAREKLTRMGYAMGGHVKGDKEEVVKGVHAHEENLHKGKKKTPAKKLKAGGSAEGKEPKHRADRLKRGGKAKGKGGKSHVTVNVVNAHGSQPKPVPVPVPVGGPPPGAGPMPPPGMGGGMPPPPDQGPGPGLKRGGRAKCAKGGQTSTGRDSLPTNRVPMGHFKKGGRAKVEYKAGAGSGLGRLEKAKNY